MVMCIRKLLIIHGYTSNKSSMLIINDALTSLYDEVIAIDLPGHGDNKLKFNLKNTLSYCLNCYDFIARKAIVDICGHSLGGMIAAYIASIRNVNKLVMLAPSFQILFDIKALKPNNRSIVKSRVPSPIAFYNIYSYIRSNIKTIYCPCLVIFGENDRVVSKKSIDFILSKAINKKVVYIFKNINHISILSSIEVIKSIKNFLNE